MYFDVDGRRAYGYTGGRPLEPDAPLVAFVHGAQHDHSVWILQSRYIAHHGWSVLALDLPGHGRSEGPALPDVASMAAWVLAAIEAARRASGPAVPGRTPGAVVIAGHSMGSLVALEAAGQAPHAVAGIALLATAFPMKVSDALLEAARTDEPRAFDMINFWSHSGISHRPGCPGPGFSVFVQNRRLMERQSPGVLLNDFSACSAYAAGVERAQAVRCPALFVLAARDAMTPPRSARELIGRMRDATVVEVPDSGHNLMSEAPDQVLAALRGWLDSLRTARPAIAAP